MKTKEEIENLKNEFSKALSEINSIKELMDLKVEYLGKKGIVTLLSGVMRELSVEDKKEYGKTLNEIRTYVESSIEILKNTLEEEELNKKLQAEAIDVTLPATKISVGTMHPLNRIIEDVSNLFISMGYEVKSGPEVEYDLYNFEMLNIPQNHPARDSQDSFYIDEEFLLRSQTSPVQVRTMLDNKDKGPIRIICPGKVYRKDNDDATHSHEFHQIEGLLLDENISMAHLKGTLEVLVKKIFDKEREIRFRPSFFPFTEPSVEVDVSCFKCNGAGCNICKKTGWIEVLGAGMVHPNVLEMSGYDSKKYSGFAFGMGVERLAMLKYEVSDIREFYTNDMRFLEQFNTIDGGETNESK